MRLIDADKLKQELKVNGLGYQYYMLDNAPTVDAIPKEWIERKLAEHWYVDYDVRELLDDWEKENEVSKR